MWDFCYEAGGALFFKDKHHRGKENSERASDRRLYREVGFRVDSIATTVTALDQPWGPENLSVVLRGFLTVALPLGRGIRDDGKPQNGIPAGDR